MARIRRNKPLVELDKPKGQIKQYWDSAKAASDYYNINVVNISQNVTGQTRQAKGHYFRYATPAEIQQYSKISETLDAVNFAEPNPVGDSSNTPNGPAPVISATPQSTDNQPDTLSPFARLLEESKKKFQNNSN